MSEEAKRRLAEQYSTGGCKLSPMQTTAQILEDALAELPRIVDADPQEW